MVKCSMCMFEGGDPLNVLRHVIKRHKNNPTFRVQCQFDQCASTYKKWDSYRKHLSRNHAIPQEVFQNDLQEGLEDDLPDLPEPPDNLLLPPDLPVPDAHQEGESDNENDILADAPVTTQDLLQWKAGKFLTMLRDDANTSQRAINVVIEELNDIMPTYLDKIHYKLKASKRTPEDTSLSHEDINAVITKMKSTEGLFHGVSSKYLLDQFLSSNGRVATEKVEVGTEEFWTNNAAPQIKERKCYAYVLPLEDTLRQLLSNPEVLQYVLHPVENSEEGVPKDVKDGSYFKEHVLFSVDKYALVIIFYYDDLTTSNVLGSKIHKFGMFYWTLANIPPHLRSSLRSINLYGVIRSKYLAKFGAQKFLSSFVSDIKKLRSEGIDIQVGNRTRNLRGSLLFSTADTPAGQALGGFKEGVGVANAPCRSCDATQDEIQEKFSESDFTLRDKETHKLRVETVTDPTLSAETRKYWSKTYGINGDSVFAQLDDFDVTKCFVQDFMHVILEGVLPFEIKNFLKYVVVEKKLISLKRLNELIKSFSYGHLQRDRPSEIAEDHLDNNLRQSSSQQLALGHVLPFLVKPSVDSCDDALDRLNNLVLLLKICNLCLSYEIEEDYVALLEHMITKHHHCFKRMYPDLNLPPKFHYMVHFPRQLAEFGPLRFSWVLRFEGAHAYFKRLMSIVLNYKNPPLTMCHRFSAKRTVQLLTFSKKHASNFLDLGDVVGSGRVTSLNDHPFQDLIRNELPALTINDSVMEARFVLVNGTRY